MAASPDQRQVERGRRMRQRTQRHEVYPGDGRVDQNCLRVMPPLASSSARPATCATASAICSGRHVVEQQPRRARPPAPGRSRSRRAPRRRAGGPAGRARARTASPTPPASATWFSLMRIASKSPTRWLTPPPRRPRASPAPQARRRLAGVEDLRAAVRATPRGRRAPSRSPRRRGAEEVQRRALGGQQRPRGAFDAQHRRARLAPLALGAEPLDRRTSGSSARNTASATSRPEMTPGAFCGSSPGRARPRRRSPRWSRPPHRRPRPARDRSARACLWSV